MRDRTERVLVLTVLGAGALIALVGLSVHPYFFQLFGDANSRLVQTRMMVDSANPGIHWIGSVWLPLPGLMFLPFSLIDPLFTTGAAGAVVCLPLHAAATVMLFRLISSLTGERAMAAGMALCFAMNPNTLYMSMTAMTETPVLFFAIAAVWQWWRFLTLRAIGSAGAGRALMWGSAAAAGATLCRYEAWPFALLGFAALAVLIVLPYGVPALHGRAIRVRELALAALSLGGIALWLAWNASQFGDPLHFHNAEYYSAAWQARSRDVREMYYLHVWESAAMYGAAAVAVFGPFLLVAALAGAPMLLLRVVPLRHAMFLAAVLLVMPAFNAVSLYLGVAEMTRWWNSRYLLLLAPFAYVTAALALGRWRAVAAHPARAAAVAATLFVATTTYQLVWQHGKVVTVADAGGGFNYRQTPHATAVGEFLAREWTGGQILIAAGSAQAHRMIQPSGIATRHFVAALNHDRQWLDPAEVARVFEWLVVGKDAGADSAAIAADFLARSGQWGSGFDLALENQYYLVYQRRPRQP